MWRYENIFVVYAMDNVLQDVAAINYDNRFLHPDFNVSTLIKCDINVVSSISVEFNAQSPTCQSSSIWDIDEL